MQDSTKKKIKAMGLNPVDFTSTAPKSMVGRVVVAEPRLFGKEADLCLFKATGGYGCETGLRGSSVFVERVCDAQRGRIERHEIIAVRTLEADLVLADEQIAKTRNYRDEIQKQYGREAIPANHAAVELYNAALADYEVIKNALAEEAKAKVEANKDGG